MNFSTKHAVSARSTFHSHCETSVTFLFIFFLSTKIPQDCKKERLFAFKPSDQMIDIELIPFHQKQMIFLSAEIVYLHLCSHHWFLKLEGSTLTINNERESSKQRKQHKVLSLYTNHFQFFPQYQ